MGGMGSGRWYRWDKQTTLEEVHNVDVRFLKKQGYLKAGVSGSLSWSCGGEPTGNIRFQTSSDSIKLIYKTRPRNGEWTDYIDIIKFDRTPCNYGNDRTWLLCPHCGKRVTSVYGLNSGFLCRHCYDLPYASQRENRFERMIRKRQKISKRIDCGSGYYAKPKGMHWSTYSKLVEQEKKNNVAIDNAIYNLSSLLRKNR